MYFDDDDFESEVGEDEMDDGLFGDDEEDDLVDISDEEPEEE